MFRWIKRLFGLGRKVDYVRLVGSPDGRVVVRFLLKGGRMGYEVEKDGKRLIGWSRLGLRFHGMPDLGDEMSLVRAVGRERSEEWETIGGEERVVVNR
jgi:hypothetical protein